MSFLQDDRGTEIATRLVDWYATLDAAGGEARTGDDAASARHRRPARTRHRAR